MEFRASDIFHRIMRATDGQMDGGSLGGVVIVQMSMKVYVNLRACLFGLWLAGYAGKAAV
jgi:hypothetical protein